MAYLFQKQTLHIKHKKKKTLEKIQKDPKPFKIKNIFHTRYYHKSRFAQKAQRHKSLFLAMYETIQNNKTLKIFKKERENFLLQIENPYRRLLKNLKIYKISENPSCFLTAKKIQFLKDYIENDIKKYRISHHESLQVFQTLKEKKPKLYHLIQNHLF